MALPIKVQKIPLIHGLLLLFLICEVLQFVDDGMHQTTKIWILTKQMIGCIGTISCNTRAFI